MSLMDQGHWSLEVFSSDLKIQVEKTDMVAKESGFVKPGPLIHSKWIFAVSTLFCFGLAFDFPTEGSLRKYIYSQACAKAVCTTMMHLKPFGRGEVWLSTEYVCWAPALACVQESAGNVCEHICSWPCLCFCIHFCSPKLPGTVTTQRGARMRGAHRRTGSAIWWLGKFLEGWGKTFLLEVNGVTNFQVHWPGAQKTAVPAASLGPCGLITNSNVGCPQNMQAWDP